MCYTNCIMHFYQVPLFHGIPFTVMRLCTLHIITLRRCVLHKLWTCSHDIYVLSRKKSCFFLLFADIYTFTGFYWGRRFLSVLIILFTDLIFVYRFFPFLRTLEVKLYEILFIKSNYANIGFRKAHSREPCDLN